MLTSQAATSPLVIAADAFQLRALQMSVRCLAAASTRESEVVTNALWAKGLPSATAYAEYETLRKVVSEGRDFDARQRRRLVLIAAAMPAASLVAVHVQVRGCCEQ